jgi:hypothetical protein
MPLTNFPTPGGDLWNANKVMRDRGRYLNSGTFGFLSGGATVNGSGILIGFAPSGDNYFQIDGGPQRWYFGRNVMTPWRQFNSSAFINGGNAWYLLYPSAKKILSRAAMLDAVDAAHQNGTLEEGYTSQQLNLGDTLTNIATIVNVAGSGLLVDASCRVVYDNTNNRARLYLRVYIDNVLRVEMQAADQHKADFAGTYTGAGASFGYCRYTSALRLEVWASSLTTVTFQAACHYIPGTFG